MVGTTPNSIQILILLGCFVVSFVTAWVLAQFPQFLPDVPNARSAHRRIVSRGGGIGIVVPFLIGSFALIGFNSNLLDSGLVTLLIGAVIISLIGLVDDALSQPALPRLILQVIVISLITVFGAPDRIQILGVIELTGWPVTIVQILWLLTCINFYNFMDGLDGLAAFQAIFMSSLIGILLLMDYENLINNQIAVEGLSVHHAQYNKLLSTCFFALAAVMLGYFIWNLPPAKLFMGDNGSYFLGFVFGYAALIFPFTTVEKGLEPGIAYLASRSVPLYTGFTAVFILLTPFLMDATLTLVKRLIRRQNIFLAHREHFFQLLHRDGWSAIKIIFLLAGLDAIALIPLGLHVLRFDPHFIFGLVVVLLIFATLLYFVVGDRISHRLEAAEHPGPVIDMASFKKKSQRF